MVASTPQYKVVIVDDEPLGREGVRLLLANESAFRVVSECASAQEGIKAVVEWHPDLLFLDINMPGGNGFDLLVGIPEELMPLIVFVTAYEQHAITAFEYHAFDYLLKPVSEKRFSEALRRARQHLDEDQRSAMADKMLSRLDELQLVADRSSDRSRFLTRFAVRATGRVFFVDAVDVDWIEASDYYSTLHCAGKTHLVRIPLSKLDEALDPGQFSRIHRSTIINRAKVKELRRRADGGYDVVLLDRTVLRMSRSYLSLLKAFPGREF